MATTGDFGFDPSRNYIIMEDNGDGTVTQIMNLPKFGLTEQIVSIMHVGIEQIIDAAVSSINTDSEAYQDAASKTTILPNSIDY